MNTNKNWNYGTEMYNEGFIKTLNDWTDDKEELLSKMDRRFDYLWILEPNGKIHFIDRLYSDYKFDLAAGCKDSFYETDETMQTRIKNNEAEMWFDNFDEVRNWIHTKEQEIT